MSGWYSEGFGNVEERAKARADQASNQIHRVWIPAMKSINLGFVDERAFTCAEHQVCIDGSWKNWATCIGKANGCPLCMVGHKPYFGTFFTVIDFTEWTDKRGNLHTAEKKLYVVKEEVAVLLKQKYQRWGGFRGKLITVTRPSKEAAASGSDFELAMINGQMVPIDWNRIQDKTPFDYPEVLKPLSMEVMREMAERAERTTRNGAAVSTGYSPPQQPQQPYNPAPQQPMQPQGAPLPTGFIQMPPQQQPMQQMPQQQMAPQQMPPQQMPPMSQPAVQNPGLPDLPF